MSFVWSTTGLPLPSVDLSGKIEQTTIRTKMESGRVRQRRRFTSGWRTISVTWELTDAEFALFQGVYKHKLSDGADFFDIILPLGDDLDTYSARFTGEGYSYSYKNVMHWRVSAQLECDIGSVLTEAEVDAILPP